MLESLNCFNIFSTSSMPKLFGGWLYIFWKYELASSSTSEEKVVGESMTGWDGARAAFGWIFRLLKAWGWPRFPPIIMWSTAVKDKRIAICTTSVTIEAKTQCICVLLFNSSSPGWTILIGWRFVSDVLEPGRPGAPAVTLLGWLNLAGDPPGVGACRLRLTKEFSIYKFIIKHGL